MTSNHIKLAIESDGVLVVTLDRPEKHNALDGRMMQSLLEVFTNAEASSDVRAVLLRGNGSSFCAGGDITWMLECGGLPSSERLRAAILVSDLFESLDHIPKPVFALVQGAALGGALGLVASCDVVVATADAVFAASEARLGIIPACVAPLLLAAIGPSHSRRLFTTAERFTADQAREMGLVHDVAPTMDHAALQISELRQRVHLSAAAATAASKVLLRSLHRGTDEKFREQRHHAIRALADSWASESGLEGMRAFLEKRSPKWSFT
jgi:methylglutaconyl-CoA hydratase